MRVVQFGLVHRLCVCSTAVINDGIIITCMNLNVEEELERPGDRFTCCLTNVSQGRAGISLMSTRLATGAAPHSGEPSPPPAPPAVPVGPGSHKQPSTAKLINHCQQVGHHLH